MRESARFAFNKIVVLVGVVVVVPRWSIKSSNGLKSRIHGLHPRMKDRESNKIVFLRRCVLFCEEGISIKWAAMSCAHLYEQIMLHFQLELIRAVGTRCCQTVSCVWTPPVA